MTTEDPNKGNRTPQTPSIWEVSQSLHGLHIIVSQIAGKMDLALGKIDAQERQTTMLMERMLTYPERFADHEQRIRGIEQHGSQHFITLEGDFRKNGDEVNSRLKAIESFAPPADDPYVRRSDLTPIKAAVYGFISLVMIAVVTALLSNVVIAG